MVIWSEGSAPGARGVIRAAEEAWGWLPSAQGGGTGAASGAHRLRRNGQTDGREGEGLAPASTSSGIPFGKQDALLNPQSPQAGRSKGICAAKGWLLELGISSGCRSSISSPRERFPPGWVEAEC